MTTYFFPSCKVQQQFPEASQQLQAYLQNRWQLPPLGCCRLNRPIVKSGDTALTVCNTCAHILAASPAAPQIQSVWELIDQDPEFPFPDFQGEVMTIQDCWLAAERWEMQQAVRSLLRKMNIIVREMPDNFAKTRFCGVNISPDTIQMAPQLQKLPERMTPEERAAHLSQSVTEKIVCYCRPCLTEINAAGYQGQHLLQLLFKKD